MKSKTEIVPQIKERVDKNSRRWIQDHPAKYDKAVKKYRDNSKSPNKLLILQYLEDCRLGDRAIDGKRREISKSRSLRVLGILENIDLWLNYKPFREVTKQDIQDFIRKLKDDVIVSAWTQKPYSETTKASMKKVVRKFWKHLKGENTYFPKEVDWITTYEPVPSKVVFSLILFFSNTSFHLS